MYIFFCYAPTFAAGGEKKDSFFNFLKMMSELLQMNFILCYRILIFVSIPEVWRMIGSMKENILAVVILMK